MRDIDSTLLREILNYDPDTGIFIWKNNFHKSRIGKVAGCLSKQGYRYIGISGENNLAHRLAWQYIYGVLPTNNIDHINCNKDDNRINNLRDVTHAQNKQNMISPLKGNSLGVLGVYYDLRRNRYYAAVKTNGVKKYLGTYKTAEEAYTAYVEAKRKSHPFSNL
jgi:hypothetical protein